MTDKATILKLTQKFLAKGQVDRAIQLWEEFVASNPDGTIYNTIGDLYLKTNDKRNALIWLHKAAKFIRTEGFSLKALAIYKKILNLDSTDPSALIAVGELNEEKGLVPDAIKFYLATIDAMNKRGQKGNVLDIYNKILNIAPSNIPLRSKVAENLVKEGLTQDASKEFIYLARLYEEKGDSKTAADLFKKALDLFPQNKDAYLSMAKMYETVGKKKEAIDTLKKALSIFRNDTEMKVQVAHQLIGQDELDDAAALLKDIGETEPENARVKEAVATIQLKRGNREKAWNIFESIFNELILMKQPEQVIAVIEQFADIDPVEVGRKLASLYRHIGDNERAFSELMKVGTFLRDSGMIEEASTVCEEALAIRPDSEEAKELMAGLRQDDSPGAPFTEAAPAATEEPAYGEVPLESTAFGGVDLDDSVTGAEVGEATGPAESLTDAEVLLRYGQTDEALKVLESLKSRDPGNVDIHKKLKSLYQELGEKELAVTECVVLANLFEKQGDLGKKEHFLNEAFSIDPHDARLAGRRTVPPEEEEPDVVTGEPEFEAVPDEATAAGSVADDVFAEEMSEADFYFRQGLEDEALKIYQKYAALMPDDQDIRNRIEQITGKREEPAETVEAEELVVEEFDAAAETVEAVPAETFEDFQAEAAEPVDAEEIPEPTLESDVLEIFQEFKKGIETELEEEDSDTHYNLGIAYKEMGLIDDSIKEFQIANKDPKKLIQASSMLGLCYKEKGLYSLAVDALKNALAHITVQDDAYWGTKFDLADAYQKNGNIKDAVELFTEIYSYNSKFRNVDERLNALRGQDIEESAKKKPAAGAKKKKDRISYI